VSVDLLAGKIDRWQRRQVTIRERLDWHIPIGNYEVEFSVPGEVCQGDADSIGCRCLIEWRFNLEQQRRRAKVAVAFVEQDREIIWGQTSAALRTDDDVWFTVTIHVGDEQSFIVVLR